MICAVTPALAGLALPGRQGDGAGLEVDLCRAVATAICDDPHKVEFVPLLSKDRFTTQQSGEVDLLSCASTRTMSRDTMLGLNFGGIDYYGGQGFPVREELEHYFGAGHDHRVERRGFLHCGCVDPGGGQFGRKPGFSKAPGALRMV